jgi:UDP-glucose 4-epimerase
VRFFSLYGNGLRKQLLWDACGKLTSGGKSAQFWGTGMDVRDWLHIEDAARLIEGLALLSDPPSLLNGGSGQGNSVSRILSLLQEGLGSEVAIDFLGESRKGDPSYYVADLAESSKLAWSPEVPIEDGIRRYAEWYQAEMGK